MRRRVKERARWFVAMTACACSALVCLSLIVRPTLAQDTATETTEVDAWKKAANYVGFRSAGDALEENLEPYGYTSGTKSKGRVLKNEAKNTGETVASFEIALNQEYTAVSLTLQLLKDPQTNSNLYLEFFKDGATAADKRSDPVYATSSQNKRTLELTGLATTKKLTVKVVTGIAVAAEEVKAFLSDLKLTKIKMETPVDGLAKVPSGQTPYRVLGPSKEFATYQTTSLSSAGYRFGNGESVASGQEIGVISWELAGAVTKITGNVILAAGSPLPSGDTNKLQIGYILNGNENNTVLLLETAAQKDKMIVGRWEQSFEITLLASTQTKQLTLAVWNLGTAATTAQALIYDLKVTTEQAQSGANVTPITGLGSPLNAANWVGPRNDYKDYNAATLSASYRVGNGTAASAGAVIGSVQYRLEKKYTQFTGTMTFAQGFSGTDTLRLRYARDGVWETRVFDVNNTTKTVNFSLPDLAGVDYLTLEVQNGNASGSSTSQVLIHNLVLTPVSGTTGTALSSIAYSDRQNWEYQSQGWINSTGTTIADSFHAGTAVATLSGNRVAFSQYRLDKKYTTLTGELVAAQGFQSADQLEVRAYKDSTTQYTIIATITNTNLRQAISVDVQNVDYLTLEVWNRSASASSAALLFAGMRLAPMTTSYRPVSGYTYLYEITDSNGNSRTPQEFLWALQDPRNYPNGIPQTRVYRHSSGKYYAEVLEGNIYLALKSDGTFDLSDAYWAGSDKIFGTNDDEAISLKFLDGKYYREVLQNGQKVWAEILGVLAPFKDFFAQFFPPVTTTTTTATTVDPLSTSSTATTEDPFFSTADPDDKDGIQQPKTGAALSKGIVVALGVLLVGCGFCGYQFFRKRKDPEFF